MTDIKLDNNSLIAIVATAFILSIAGTCSVSEIVSSFEAPAPPAPTEVQRMMQEAVFAKACGDACSQEYLRIMDVKRGICECASKNPVDHNLTQETCPEPVVCPEVVPFAGPPLLNY